MTRIWPVVVPIVVQAICPVIFVGDVAKDIFPQGLATSANLSELAASDASAPDAAKP